MTVWKITNIKGADIGAPYGAVVTDATYCVETVGGGFVASRTGDVRITKLKPLQDGGYTALGLDAGNFIQYDSVTEQDVVNWVKSVLGTLQVEIIERSVTQELESKINTPPKVKPIDLPVPWSTE